MRLVFRVSAMRYGANGRRGRERGLFSPSFLFLSPLSFHRSVFPTRSCFSSSPRILCVPGPTARTEEPLCYNPRLLSLPTPPPVFFYRYFDRNDRPSVPGRDPPKRRRQLLQKTGAARRIIILLYCHRRPLLLRHLSF